MSDLRLTHHEGEVEVEGITEAGEEFVDAYTALDVEVLDSGLITVTPGGLEALEIRAREAGLTIETT